MSFDTNVFGNKYLVFICQRLEQMEHQGLGV